MADIIKAFYLAPPRAWVMAYVVMALPLVVGTCIANLMLGVYSLAFLGLGVPFLSVIMGFTQNCR